MRALVALVLVALFVAASCGTNPSDAGNITNSAGVVASCHPTCSTAADCGVPGDPLQDSSHYACKAGQCQWLGCRSANECTAEAGGGTFRCEAADAASVPDCVLTCQKAADCVAPSNTEALNDVHHYACNAGTCDWLGCKSTAECVAATHTSKVSCEAQDSSSPPSCVPTCTTASDCVVQGTGLLGDKSHYACQANRCVWLGCKSTAECTTALASSRYVCE